MGCAAASNVPSASQGRKPGHAAEGHAAFSRPSAVTLVTPMLIPESATRLAGAPGHFSSRCDLMHTGMRAVRVLPVTVPVDFGREISPTRPASGAASFSLARK